MKYITLVIGLFWVSTGLFAQRDTLYTLPINEFIERVKKNHPLALQADLMNQKAESNERKVLGSFDPKLEAGIEEKYFDDTHYFSYRSGGLKIPTRSPISIKAAYDLNNGTYLDESAKTPNSGLVTAGLSLSVLRGFLIDERRMALQQAEAFYDMADAERTAILNALLLDAYNAYWNWWNSYNKRLVSEELVSIADQRKQAVIERAVAGERPFIDTVEAHMQVQMRQQQMLESIVIEVKSRYFLSSFLWKKNEDTVPTGLMLNDNTLPTDPEGIWPANLFAFSMQQIPEMLKQNHPDLLYYDAKMSQLASKERWRKEQLKPQLDVEYNVLSSGTTTPENTAFSPQNYKWGLTFSLPLFLRSARGDLQLTRIEINETQLQQELKLMELSNKLEASISNIENMRTQLSIAQANVVNYFTLLEAERTRFLNGESSLFLVNQREMAYADAKLKALDMQVKLEMAIVEAAYFTGRLFE